MFCMNCGNNLPDGSVACNRCGMQFVNYNMPYQQPQQYQQPPQQEVPSIYKQAKGRRPSHYQPPLTCPRCRSATIVISLQDRKVQTSTTADIKKNKLITNIKINVKKQDRIALCQTFGYSWNMDKLFQ